MDGVWWWFSDTRGIRKSPCSPGARAGGGGEEDKQTHLQAQGSLQGEAQGMGRKERERERTGGARKGFTEKVMTELS